MNPRNPAYPASPATTDEVHPSLAEASPAASSNHKSTTTRSTSEIREWLIVNVASLLEIAPAQIDSSRPLDEYGMDSIQAVCLSGDLQIWLGQEVSATLVWDYPSIDLLCTYLAQGHTPPACIADA